MNKSKFGTCAHCKKYRVIYARDLCNRCHKNRDIRDLYASLACDEFVHTPMFISDPFVNSNFYDDAPGWSTSINPFI